MTQNKDTDVAPLAGAWIETPSRPATVAGRRVAPLAGAWIETLCYLFQFLLTRQVAPLAGAWIETTW